VRFLPTACPRIPLAQVSFLLLLSAYSHAASPYPWKTDYSTAASLAHRVPPPEGFVRVEASTGSFAHWLRHLPLKPGRPPVLLFNGRPKRRQDAHEAVVDMDAGTRDLQQCADAVIRLRAEYLFSRGDAKAVRFDLTSGDAVPFSRWADGERLLVKGNKVRWTKSASAGGSYKNFRDYLTRSLKRELRQVPDVADLRAGDVFIQGGSPGHAVIVVDLAAQPGTGKRLFLLAQSYMPAQEVHILKNPRDRSLSPWYSTDFGDALATPEWEFRRKDLYRFPGAD
jgi:hypothetical protein